MVQVIVRIPDELRRHVLQGSEREVESRLRDLFPEETKDAVRLLACIQAVQESGVAEVTFEVMQPNLDANILPSNFLTADQSGDEPWPRRS